MEAEEGEGAEGELINVFENYEYDARIDLMGSKVFEKGRQNDR